MNILIIGCGKVGSNLANTLFRMGHDVSVVERDPMRFAALDPDFDGLTVEGIPMDQDVLRNAGIEGCDAMAAVTEYDNLNITIAQIAREIFKVPHMVVRIADPAREDIYSHFGLKSICPTNLTVDTICSAILNRHDEQTLTFGTATVTFHTFPVGKSMQGKPVSHIPLQENEHLYGLIATDGSILPAEYIADEYRLSEGEQIISSRLVD